jgi:hypothetical protein
VGTRGARQHKRGTGRCRAGADRGAPGCKDPWSVKAAPASWTWRATLRVDRRQRGRVRSRRWGTAPGHRRTNRVCGERASQPEPDDPSGYVSQRAVHRGERGHICRVCSIWRRVLLSDGGPGGCRRLLTAGRGQRSAAGDGDHAATFRTSSGSVGQDRATIAAVSRPTGGGVWSASTAPDRAICFVFCRAMPTR